MRGGRSIMRAMRNTRPLQRTIPAKRSIATRRSSADAAMEARTTASIERILCGRWTIGEGRDKTGGMRTIAAVIALLLVVASAARAFEIAKDGKAKCIIVKG